MRLRTSLNLKRKQSRLNLMMETLISKTKQLHWKLGKQLQWKLRKQQLRKLRKQLQRKRLKQLQRKHLKQLKSNNLSLTQLSKLIIQASDAKN